MTATHYAVLFRIECLHEYFGGLCRSLAVSPTGDCRKLMEAYRMLFRGSAGGGVVLAPLESPSGALRQFDESLPFTFKLTSVEPALDSYTESGADERSAPAQSIFYFDNTADQQAELFGSSRQLLHPSGNALQAAALPVKPKRFGFTLPATASRSAPRVVEPLTKQVLWEGAAANLNAPLMLDLRRLAEGRYMLVLDDKELLRFYLSDVPPAQQWGAVSIYAGGSRQAEALPRNCRALDSSGVATSRTFTLALASRKTIWRYYIIDSAGKQDFSSHELFGTLRKPADDGQDSNIAFVRLPQPVPVDGRTAWVFESKAPLPLLQSPASEFLLTLRPSGNGKRGERAFRLPFAQPGSFVLGDGRAPRPLCSEVFVYF
jgi:hypothetical protein